MIARVTNTNKIPGTMRDASERRLAGICFFWTHGATDDRRDSRGWLAYPSQHRI